MPPPGNEALLTAAMAVAAWGPSCAAVPLRLLAIARYHSRLPPGRVALATLQETVRFGPSPRPRGRHAAQRRSGALARHFNNATELVQASEGLLYGEGTYRFVR